MRLSRPVIVQILVAVVFAALVAAGIFRDELPDVIANARLICFSCIGLK